MEVMLLQGHHGDSPEMVEFINNKRKISQKFLGKYTSINKNVGMYTNYLYKNEWVLIVHGMGSSARKMAPYAKKFQKLGYNTITVNTKRTSAIDFFQHWEEDINAVLEQLKVKFNNIEPSVIYGQSIGASVVLIIAASHKYNFKKVIVDSPFDDFHESVLNMFPVLGTIVWPFIKKMTYPTNIVAKIQCLDIPVLYCYGLKDDVTTPQQVERLIAGTPLCRHISVEHAGHCRAMFYNPKAYWNTVKGFLNEKFPKIDL